MTTEKFANEVGYDGRYIYINKDEIKKSSSNIIDLIEVGDYVNGYQVLEKEKSKHGNRIITTDLNNIYINKSNSIKLIVTKEQFESMEYEVGE